MKNKSNNFDTYLINGDLIVNRVDYAYHTGLLHLLDQLLFRLLLR